MEAMSMNKAKRPKLLRAFLGSSSFLIYLRLANSAGNDDFSAVARHAKIFLAIWAFEIKEILTLATHEAPEIFLFLALCLYSEKFIKLCPARIEIR